MLWVFGSILILSFMLFQQIITMFFYSSNSLSFLYFPCYTSSWLPELCLGQSSCSLVVIARRLYLWSFWLSEVILIHENTESRWDSVSRGAGAALTGRFFAQACRLTRSGWNTPLGDKPVGCSLPSRIMLQLFLQICRIAANIPFLREIRDCQAKSKYHPSFNRLDLLAT